jgi:hypothetical protein
VAELLAFVSDVLALLAEVEADVALEAAAVAEAEASLTFSVTWLIVISVFASPAPPSPLYIAI